MNAVAMQARSRKRFRVSDFLLQFEDTSAPKEGAQPSWQKMKFIAQMFAAQANADAKAKKKRRR